MAGSIVLVLLVRGNLIQANPIFTAFDIWFKIMSQKNQPNLVQKELHVLRSYSAVERVNRTPPLIFLAHIL